MGPVTREARCCGRCMTFRVEVLVVLLSNLLKVSYWNDNSGGSNAGVVVQGLDVWEVRKGY